MKRALLTVIALLFLGACSSSGDGSSSTPPTTGANTGSVQATKLAATLRTATKDLTSAHITVDAGALGGSSDGDVSFAGGTTSSDFTINLGGKTRIITVGDTSWAMLPGGRNTSGKPWLVVSSDTGNEFVRALVNQVSVLKAAVSVPAIADVVANASSVQDLGSASQGHHYALSLAMDKVSDTDLGKQLATLGTDPLPVDLYLDPKGRPVYIKLAAKIGSQPLPIAVTVSDFNAPVHISAPPKDQIGS